MTLLRHLIANNINNTRTLVLPQAWVENKHRAEMGSHACPSSVGTLSP